MNDTTRWPCAAPAATGCALLVSVIPNAKRTEAVGLHDGCLRVRLHAPAIEGRANEALIAWLADALKLTRRQVVLRHGASGRRKRLELDCPLPQLLAWLDSLPIAT